MREGSDADPIDPGPGEVPDGCERDATRGFELDFGCDRVAPLDGQQQLFRAEIVDQDDIGAQPSADSSCSSESTSISIVVPGSVPARAGKWP